MCHTKLTKRYIAKLHIAVVKYSCSYIHVFIETRCSKILHTKHTHSISLLVASFMDTVPVTPLLKIFGSSPGVKFVDEILRVESKNILSRQIDRHVSEGELDSISIGN